jgi:hypothetical protein
MSSDMLQHFMAEYQTTKITHEATIDEKFEAVVKRMQICQFYLYNAPQDMNYMLMQKTYNRLVFEKDQLIQAMYVQLETEINKY